MTSNDYTPQYPDRELTSGIYAYVVNQGRVWVEEVNQQNETAKVCFDCGEGSRSRVHVVKTSAIDPTREWKFR